jgi:hypothetical protein
MPSDAPALRCDTGYEAVLVKLLFPGKKTKAREAAKPCPLKKLYLPQDERWTPPHVLCVIHKVSRTRPSPIPVRFFAG